MFLSKRPNGIYYFFYTNSDGKRGCLSTKARKKQDAIRVLPEIQLRIQNQLKFNRNSPDLSIFCFNYLKFSETYHSSNTHHMIKIILKTFQKIMGNPLLTEIESQDCEKFISEKSSLSKVTAQKYLAHLRACFNKAVTDGLIDENPFKLIKNYKLPERLPVFFNQREFEILILHITDCDLRDLINFAVNTGLRQTELLTLKWTQVDIFSRQIILSNQTSVTKSKKVRTIPLNSVAAEIMEKRLRMRSNQDVFTYGGRVMTQDFISKKFKKIVKQAELNSHLTFHSLRHTFASWLVQKGVSIYEVSKLLGHADIKTTQIYAHLRSDDLRNAVDRLD